ncbi:MAG: DNA gyrase subunit A, partial [Flammeovirgaceae bacterium]|nr:DNA gyrase subunit A [Flammeovirgaceae bacterium]MDW8287435.1 DNA gyrase C-terminal beta-propeller domain-containing protein [Flammeovirgaceae bacterium]
ATLNLKELIRYYVQHRHEVVVRRTKFDLDDAQKRLHVLEGYLKALDHLDHVIQLIRQAKDPDAAKTTLIATFDFSETQAKAILELRLQRLTNMEREKIVQEHREVTQLVADLQDILAHQSRRMTIIKDELKELKEKYGDPRRTQIVFDAEDLEMEDMIAEEDMVITISKDGYIKRTSLKEYRQQGRGGVGSRGVGAKEDDYTEHLFVANTHEYLLFFTNKGKVLWLKTYRVTEGNKTSKGRPLQNLIQISSDEKVQAILKVKTLEDEEYIKNHYVVLCTVQGTIKKTSLEAYSRPRKDGIIAINLDEGDRLLNAALTDGTHEIIIACSTGKAIRFDEETVRPMGRNARGVKGIEFSEENDYVVGMVCVKDAKTATLLVVSEKGYGKRSEVEEYRKTNRGGKGVTTLNITEKTGRLISIQNVTDDNDLMIMTKAGIAIRMRVSDISVQGRNTQGVRLIKLNEGDEISSVTAFEVVEEESALENDGKQPDAEIQ